jgi:hypothetical protein
MITDYKTIDTIYNKALKWGGLQVEWWLEDSNLERYISSPELPWL